MVKDAADNDQMPKFPIQLLDSPVTAQSLFYTSEGPVRAATLAEIADTETRLKVSLPETLRQIYLTQNGGYLMQMCIVNNTANAPFGLDDIITPFSGYNDLHACERLETAHENFLNFAEEHDEDYKYLFSGGTDRMVLLAKWYQESLFLDYNKN